MRVPAVAEVSLLRAFELRHGGVVVPLPQTSQRLVAFLAVHERALQRPYVAGSLWPEVSDDRADGSLRSALWRMGSIGSDIVAVTNRRIGLDPAIRIDLSGLTRLAHDLTDCAVAGLALAARGFEEDLLPDWYDDWITEWRERWRQIRFHALEDVAHCLILAGDCGSAIEVGLAAVRAEPLRESAHRVVIEAHLAEGNRQEAVRHFRTYERLLRAELGIEPSPPISALVEPLIQAMAAR